jgi:hypothetical protein
MTILAMLNHNQAISTGLTRMRKMAAASNIKDLALVYYMQDLLKQKKSIKRVTTRVKVYRYKVKT